MVFNSDRIAKLSGLVLQMLDLLSSIGQLVPRLRVGLPISLNIAFSPSNDVHTVVGDGTCLKEKDM